ncbi:hypothetical protein [Pseudosulfitobacter sp. SM2401]|uniref:hypothetical protein n=1 Tax=Pseudosulfitobacter sp. SM2401 TaxID=3350098 RepID=UPI0036F2B758
MKNFAKAAIYVAASLGLFVTNLHAQTAQSGKLTVELNKFEENETVGCRAFFLFRNQTELTLEGFEMSLAILNTEGIIDRLLSIDAAPISAARTTLKLFEIPEIACSEISEILLHELASCKPQNADEMDCFPLLDLISRTPAQLVK